MFPELLPGLDEVVAGVEVAVVLQRRAVAAGGGVDAQEVTAEMGLEGDVEELHVDPPHVAPDPLLEDVDQELPVLRAAHGTSGDEAAGLRVQGALPAAGPVAPSLVGGVEGLLGGALDDGDELDPLGPELVAEEAVDLPAALLVRGVDRAEDVEGHVVGAQVAPALHDPVEGALAAPVEPVGVVQLARPVHAQAHQEVVLLEEGAPVVVEQDPVGLEGLLHDLSRPAVLLDQLDGAGEEGEPHERRLAPLPGHRHLGCPVGLEQLADVGLEGGLGHPLLVAGVQRILGQEEAVGAVDVAGGPARLGQEVERRRRERRRDLDRCGGLDGHARGLEGTARQPDRSPAAAPLLSRTANAAQWLALPAASSQGREDRVQVEGGGLLPRRELLEGLDLPRDESLHQVDEVGVGDHQSQ